MKLIVICNEMLPDKWCHITEVANLNRDCCDNIKSHHVSMCVCYAVTASWTQR